MVISTSESLRSGNELLNTEKKKTKKTEIRDWSPTSLASSHKKKKEKKRQNKTKQKKKTRKQNKEK